MRFDDDTVKLFWSYVDKRGPNDCLPWTGSKSSPKPGAGSGYGHFNIRNKSYRAHRISLRLANVAFRDDFVVDHLCRNPECVNPRHLEAVPSAVNTLRGVGPTAKSARQDKCKNGHDLTPDNLFPYSIKKGWRVCIKCQRERDSEREKRKKLSALKEADE